MSIAESFLWSFTQHGISTGGERFLVAASGGLDSTVLSFLCKKWNLSFSLAHCNFQLRGDESRRDEVFVRDLAATLNVPCLVRQFETEEFAATTKCSVQEAARTLRYRWFAELQRTGGFTCTLLGHHADDKIETMLMHLFRGTGLKGLLGMPVYAREPHRLFRPLLDFRRTQLEQYALEQNLRWVEDSSNQASKYTRNFFRIEVLPAIKQVFPQVEENLLNTMERLTSVQRFYNQSMESLKDKVMVKKGEEWQVPVRLLRRHLDTPLIFEIIRHFGFGEKQVGEVEKLLNAATGRYIESSTHQVIRHRLWLVIAPRTAGASIVTLLEGQEDATYERGRLTIQKMPVKEFSLQKNEHLAQVDARRLRYPLLLRRWKAGDYFYPLGMPKKKKLSRFFIDRKLSRSEKENVWVLESEGRIVWVVGHRIDDRFKMTESTREVTVFKFTP